MSDVMFALLLLGYIPIRTVSLSPSQSQHNQHEAPLWSSAKIYCFLTGRIRSIFKTYHFNPAS